MLNCFLWHQTNPISLTFSCLFAQLINKYLFLGHGVYFKNFSQKLKYIALVIKLPVDKAYRHEVGWTPQSIVYELFPVHINTT